MTRSDWIDKVLKPWRDGDTLQHKSGNGRWEESGCFHDGDRDDPMLYDRLGGEYRIKPRTTKIVIETEHYYSRHDFPRIADLMEDAEGQSFPPCFIEAIRNAKPMPE